MATGRYTEAERDLVERLRNEGKGYNEIADLLNRSKDSVKKHCRKRGLGGFKKNKQRNPNVKDDLIKIIDEKLKEKTNGRFGYHSGYEGADKNFKVQCIICGGVQERNAQSLRREKKIRCDTCLQHIKQIKEITNENKNVLDKKVKDLNIKIKIEVEQLRSEVLKVEKECVECGELFKTTKDYQKFCNNICQTRYHGRQKDVMRRALYHSTSKDKDRISLQRLVKRDKGRCAICGDKVDYNDRVYTEKGAYVAGEMHPSIDHIKPISKGGTHTWDNVQLAHRRCNTRKSDKQYYTGVEGQIVMSV